MTRSYIIAIITVVAITLAGCVTPLRFVSTEAGGQTDFDSFSTSLPSKWMKLNRTAYLIMTRDGIPCQGIMVERLSLDEDFQEAPKAIKKGMLPHEQAEVYLDNLKADKTLLNLTILKNSPVALSGKDGFRVSYTYQTENGLVYQSLDYGFLAGEFFFLLQYDAPQRHYYNDSLDVFNEVVESFKLSEET